MGLPEVLLGSNSLNVADPDFWDGSVFTPATSAV